MIDVPFERPRDVEVVRADPRFAELRAHIWHQLHTAPSAKSSRDGDRMTVQADNSTITPDQAGAIAHACKRRGGAAPPPVHAQHRHPRGLADLRARPVGGLGARVDQSLFTTPSRSQSPACR